MASEQQNGHHANGSTESAAAAAATAPDDEHAQLWSSEADPHDSLPRRALHALLSPFSATALAGLPRVKRPERYLRADAIPHTETNDVGERPTVRDYHSINLPPNVRIPKKLATSVKVEGKIWFANERSESELVRFFFPLAEGDKDWVSWLNISVLLATLAIGLFNASKDEIARDFAYFYAFVSICTMVRLGLYKNFQIVLSFPGLWLRSISTSHNYDPS
jgi:hypothetical protein